MSLPSHETTTTHCRLAGGLAWLGILAVGTIGEQVKTRLEVAAEKAGTTDVSDSKEVSWCRGTGSICSRAVAG